MSMGGNAAVKAVQVMENVERILAIELMNAAQAIDLQRPTKTSPYLEKFLEEFRSVVPFNSIDRVMYKDIDAATDFLRYGDFEANPQA